MAQFTLFDLIAENAAMVMANGASFQVHNAQCTRFVNGVVQCVRKLFNQFESMTFATSLNCVKSR